MGTLKMQNVFILAVIVFIETKEYPKFLGKLLKKTPMDEKFSMRDMLSDRPIEASPFYPTLRRVRAL